MRYVDDPGVTLRELARVVRPGGAIAGLEFGVPPSPAARALWRLYTRIGLPLAGRLIAPGWHDVGEFLGPSIEELWRRMPARAPRSACGATPASRTSATAGSASAAGS